MKDVRYFARSKFFGSLVHKTKFGLIWRSWIPLLSFSELGEKLRATIILGKCVKKIIIKLLLAYSFRKMFFIGQNLKHVHMTYSFLERLIFSWLTLVNIFSLEFISHSIKEILYINTNSKENHHKRDITCFHLPSILRLKNPIFSVSWIHFLKVIKRPFCRGVKLINVIVFSSPTPPGNIIWCVKSQTGLFIYLPGCI